MGTLYDYTVVLKFLHQRFPLLVVAVNISRTMTARTIIMIVSWRTSGSTLGTIWPLHIGRPRSVVMALKTPSAVAGSTLNLLHLLLLRLLLLILLLLLLLFLLTVEVAGKIKLKASCRHVQNILRCLWHLSFGTYGNTKEDNQCKPF